MILLLQSKGQHPERQPFYPLSSGYPSQDYFLRDLPLATVLSMMGVPLKPNCRRSWFIK